MCCLKFENDIYAELRKGMPDLNEKVMTRDGMGKVIDSDILAGRVKVRLYTGEKDDNGVDKLGSDVFTFSKEEVERTKKPQGGGDKGKAQAAEGGGKKSRSRKRRRRPKKDGAKTS